MYVYLNGRFIPREQAAISVDDRGFLFGDSLYEVIRSYRGFLFEQSAHLKRLQRGLEALRMRLNEFDDLRDIAAKLIADNDLANAEALVYFQITRGISQPRRHAFPSESVRPTVYVATNPIAPDPKAAAEGVAAITVPDIRWGRCDIKTTNLLANVLANQQAQEAGAAEAIFVRDHVVIEGSHSNLFAVFEETIRTHPKTEHLLAGITRQVVIDLCQQLNLDIQESPIPEAALARADEIFLTQTSGEVVPLVRLNGKSIGNGKPGSITHRLQEAFSQWVLQARKNT